MAKAAVTVSAIQPGGPPGIFNITFQYTTDTGLADSGVGQFDTSKSNAENAASLRQSAVDAIQSYPNGPTITVSDVVLFDYPN